MILIFFAGAARSLSAQHVPGTNWKQRETDEFVIIYPDTMSDEAAALALALNDVLSDARNRLPVAHDKKKWPLVLTNLGLEANGFVTLAPRHSVWYATPGEDFSAVSDWWMLLARHEARHMAQFDAADKGTTRVLHILFGELGWGAGIVLGTPSWLLEGDAVVMETVLSEEGRGRDPLFTQEVMAIAAENTNSSYYKAVNPSYKTHVPDYYKVGYAISSWIREEYGSDSMEEIYRSSARIPIPAIGINTGMKRTTDQLPKEIYREMIADLALKAAGFQKAGDWTDADIISPEQESFARYDALFESSLGHVYGRKETMAQAPRLVRVDTDTSIMRLPSGGRVSLAETSGDNAGSGETRIRVAWNSLRYHPVFLGSSVSDITVVDLNSKEQVIRRKIVVSGSRYLYPVLSPDGSKLAVVEILENGSSALVILDADNGEEEERLDLSALPGPATAAYPSWSPDSQKLVFSLRNDGGRRISQWHIGSDHITHLTEPSFNTVKAPVFSADGKGVFYSSNEIGLEAIWYLDIVGIEAPHPPRPAARRWYGAARPAVSADGNHLYLVEYASTNGEVVSRVNYGQLESGADQGPISIADPISAAIIIEENPQAIDRDQEIRDPEIREQVTAKGNMEYPESSYRPGRNAFNVHSWGFYLGPSPGSFSVNELLLNVQSRDVLGTMTFEAGALYETSESSPGAYINLSFTGIRPVISIQGEYRYRSPKSDPFNQTTFSLAALYPMNLARTGIWDHSLNLGITAGLLSYYPTANNPGANYPYLSYAADWSRLRPGSDRAIRPDLGWRLRTIYSQIPLPGEYGDSASAELDLYFPGGFRNSSLSIGGGIEYRTANFSPVISQPRGYEWENPDSTIIASVDYEFPLGYPDLPLASVIFIQRFRLGLFSDFGFINSGFDRRWSTGATLTMDFAAFNNFSGLSIGLQFSWLWEEDAPQFTFMLMDLPI